MSFESSPGGPEVSVEIDLSLSTRKIWDRAAGARFATQLCALMQDPKISRIVAAVDCQGGFYLRGE